MASVYTILPFIAYLIVANPSTYKAVRGVAGNWVSSAEGLASTKGLVLHAVVYVLVVTLLMRLFAARKSGFEMALSMAPLDDVMGMDPSSAAVPMMDPSTGASPAPAPKTFLSSVLGPSGAAPKY